MGVQNLQSFIESQCPGACVPVDLLKIARSVSVRRVGNNRGNYKQQIPFPSYNRLRLVLDGECCLDRLYGGYFSDWVCGGQWYRMVQFLSLLVQTLQSNNIDVAVFFNGGLEPERTGEWVKQQVANRKKISQVLKHVSMKATPPPKVWWIPPVCLRTCLRMALRHLNITVVCTMDDHHQEVIAYCREKNFDGLMAEDAEYAIFDPPRYFSSEQMKLTYKGSLETKEFILDEVAKNLNLHPNRFCVFAALLGNYLLTEDDLSLFHKQLLPETKTKGTTDALISACVSYVRNIPCIDNLDSIGEQVFGSQKASKIQKFKDCVQYYLNGTKDGFLHYRPSMQGRNHVESGCYPNKTVQTSNDQTSKKPNAARNNSKGGSVPTWNATSQVSENTASPTNVNGSNTLASDGQNAFPLPCVTDPSRFASETEDTEKSARSAYEEVTNAYGGIATPQIVIEPPVSEQIGITNSATTQNEENSKNEIDSKEEIQNHNNIQQSNFKNNSDASTTLPKKNEGLLTSSSSSSTSSSPNRCSPEVSWTPTTPTTTGKSANSTLIPDKDETPQPSEIPLTNGVSTAKVNSTSHIPPNIESKVKLPNVAPEVMRTTSQRHEKGLMSPWISQVLTQGEIKIPILIEEEYPQELPSPALLFRPLRQMVYAILFNLHHLHYMAKQRKEKEGVDDTVPVIVIKEWVWSKQNQFRCPDTVHANLLDWAVPTVQRLWFGSAPDEKKRRMRAFLTCLKSDAPIIFNTNYVPQHLLVLCCVLRYIMAEPQMPVLRKQELDAFLAQAVSPYLMNAQYTQNMQLPLVMPRGIQLASLFMFGVECALFANDACGAPIPWHMCCPWLFFDGKLFHYKLLKANSAKNLVDVCDGQLDQVAKVERMRAAILEGLQVQFAHPPLVAMAPRPGIHHPRFRGGALGGPPILPLTAAGHPLSLQNNQHGSPNRGRGRGGHNAPVTDRRGMIARGGQLEIAGVVVGSWGANYGHMQRARGLQIPPQVTSVGGVRRYAPGAGPPLPTGASFTRGFLPRRPTVPARIRTNPPFGQIKSNNKKKGKNRSKTGGKLEVTPAVGRGCTVDSPSNNQTVRINQLLSQDTSHSVSAAANPTSAPLIGSEQFANAQEEVAEHCEPVIVRENFEPLQSSPNCVANNLPYLQQVPGVQMPIAAVGQGDQLQ